MDSFWLSVYLVLAAAAVVQALLITVQTAEHCRYARSCWRELERFQPTGRARVLAPCKGVDVGLEENLAALLRQDYDDYEVVFVVESEDDPACAVIRRVMRAHREVDSRLLVAGRATDTGQKIHNLRAGTADLPPEIKFLAFVDSDAGPRPEWLRVLIGRLLHPGRGAVTGYRWFLPARPSLANYLVCSVNIGVMSLLGRTSRYLIWGGSWGMRRQVFDRSGLHQAWRRTLSDDLMASRLMCRARWEVRYEPICLVASPLDANWRQAYEFIRRQYFVARFYVPRWWRFALWITTLANFGWWGNLALTAAALVWGILPAWLPAGVFALLYGLSIYRGTRRRRLIDSHFPEHRKVLEPAARFDTFAAPLVALLNWVAVLGSMFGRELTWRGITYRIYRGGKIRTVGRRQPAEPKQRPAYREAG